MGMLRYFRYRVAIIFAVFTIILSALFGLTLLDCIYETDDDLRFELMQQFERKAINHFHNTGELPIADSVFAIELLRSDRHSIPPHLAQLAPGDHEFVEPSVHVIKGSLPVINVETAPDYYVVHMASDSHVINRNFDKILTTLLVSVAAISIIGVVIGLLLARQVARPVQALQQQIRATDPNDIAYEPLQREDEFGEVSLAYSETLDRIRSAFEREKRFSGYASHELRTPVAIIKSSLNLWQTCQRVDDPGLATQKQQAAVKRIAVASKQMEEVIQTFLLLSRTPKQEREQDLEPVDLREMVALELDKFQGLESYQSIQVNAELDQSVTLLANAVAANVIATTLLRNSFEYCAGEIQIELTPDHLRILNDIDQLRIEKAEHFGFGLDIVRQLCERMGWNHQISQPKGDGYQVLIHFRPE